MKIGGVLVDGPAEEVLVLPRLDGDITILAQAVLDMTPFEVLCPEPAIPQVLRKGGFSDNEDDPGYTALMDERGTKRFSYMCIKSLEPSNIEWENVSIDDPSTWANWQAELTKAGISSTEQNRIIRCVMQANSLDEGKLQEARENFLLGRGEKPLSTSGRDTERVSTPSGEPAKGSK